MFFNSQSQPLIVIALGDLNPTVNTSIEFLKWRVTVRKLHFLFGGGGFIHRSVKCQSNLYS